MPNFVATYDLRTTPVDPHSEFLRQAPIHGWSLWVFGTRRRLWYRLPNTTIVGEFDDIAAAKRAFRATVGSTRAALRSPVVVEKHFLAEYVASSFTSDVTRTRRP